MTNRKPKKPKTLTVGLAGLGFETAVKGALETGKDPSASKRKPEGKK
jgi:hypothetical protein